MSDLVERVAKAVYPLFAGFVTGRAPMHDYDATLEDNREAARDLARAAIAAIEADAISSLREALKPFAFFGDVISADPAFVGHEDDTPCTILMFSDGVKRTLTFGDLRRARQAFAQEAREK